MDCPHCNRRMFQQSSDGKTKLRVNILVWSPDGACETNCRHCGKAVQIPVYLDQSAMNKKNRVKLVIKPPKN